MPGNIPLNDAMPASGLDPGSAPDWRSVAPSSARLSFATPQFSCTRNERRGLGCLALVPGGLVLELPASCLAQLCSRWLIPPRA